MNSSVLRKLTSGKTIGTAIALLIVGGWIVKNSRWSGPDIPQDVLEDFDKNKTELVTNNNAPAPATEKTYDASQDFDDNQADIVQSGGKAPPRPELNSEEILQKVQSVDSDPLLQDRDYYSLIFLRTQLLENDHLASADLKTLNRVFEDTRALEKIEKKGGNARESFHEKFKDHLVKLECKESKSYVDSEGFKTIGIGFNMDKPDARLVWTKAFGKDVQKGDKTQIIDQVDFDDAFYGRVSLTEEQIDQLYDAGMFGFVDVYEDDNLYDGVVPDKSKPKTEKGYDGKEVSKRYPGYYEQLKNYVRPHAMEDVPYNAQFALLSIIYQTPGTLAKNMDEVKDIVDVFCDKNASSDDIVEAGSRLASIYEETLARNDGPKSPNLKETRWIEKYHLLCGETDGAYPIKDNKLMERIEDRLHVHGNSRQHTKIIIGGHLPESFDPQDLTKLNNQGKQLTIYAPEDNVIYKMDKDKRLTQGTFEAPPSFASQKKSTTSPSSSS